jgi:hypothetical protein
LSLSSDPLRGVAAPLKGYSRCASLVAGCPRQRPSPGRELASFHRAGRNFRADTPSKSRQEAPMDHERGPPLLTDDARWAAVAARDRSADGQFVTCVRTTRIYCRPSCSGRPLRKNVFFVRTPGEARTAGLRACKRCRPDEALCAAP